MSINCNCNCLFNCFFFWCEQNVCHTDTPEPANSQPNFEHQISRTNNVALSHMSSAGRSSNNKILDLEKTPTALPDPRAVLSPFSTSSYNQGEDEYLPISPLLLPFSSPHTAPTTLPLTVYLWIPAGQDSVAANPLNEMDVKQIVPSPNSRSLIEDQMNRPNSPTYNSSTILGCLKN